MDKQKPKQGPIVLRKEAAAGWRGDPLFAAEPEGLLEPFLTPLTGFEPLEAEPEALEEEEVAKVCVSTVKVNLLSRLEKLRWAPSFKSE